MQLIKGTYASSETGNAQITAKADEEASAVHSMITYSVSSGSAAPPAPSAALRSSDIRTQAQSRHNYSLMRSSSSSSRRSFSRLNSSFSRLSSSSL